MEAEKPSEVHVKELCLSGPVHQGAVLLEPCCDVGLENCLYLFAVASSEFPSSYCCVARPSVYISVVQKPGSRAIVYSDVITISFATL